MTRDRRRHVRAPLLANVMLFSAEQCLGSHRVLNLSGGGLLLAGVAPLKEGAKLTAILELPTGRPLRAEVVIARERTATDETAFALAFTRISDSGRDALQNAVLDTLEEAGAAQVLIASSLVGNGIALKRELKRLGRTSFCVTAPMEAVRFFELQNGVDLVLADEAIGKAHGGVLFDHLAERHPGILRVLITAHPGQVPANTQEVVPAPWTADGVRRVLRMRSRTREHAAIADLPAPAVAR